MRTLVLFLGLSLSSVALAVDLPTPVLTDHIDFQISAKRWIQTETASLTITLQATLTNADLVKARQNIMEKLTKIAPGDWHLTQFDRSQDASGLEKLNVRAEARVPQAKLTRVYANTQAVSKPGEAYQVSSIEFKPSFEELQQARIQLRETLYHQIQDELARINRVYTTQHFTLNRLIFTEGADSMAPVANDRVAPNVMMMASVSKSDPIALSNELIMTATVEVASPDK